MYIYYNNELYHHGVQGQKWGVRNAEWYPIDKWKASLKNKDSSGSVVKKKHVAEIARSSLYFNDIQKADAIDEQLRKSINSSEQHRRYQISQQDKENIKKAVIIGASVVGITAACYLAYKYDAVGLIKNGLSGEEALTTASSRLGKVVTELNGDRTFKKGYKFHKTANKVIADSLGRYNNIPTSIVANLEDRAAYATFLKDWENAAGYRDVTLQATKDIKVPSEQEARRIFTDLYQNNSKFKAELESIISDSMLESNDMDEIFNNGVHNITIGNKAAYTLINAFKEKGYDAVTDYGSKGTFASDPLILFKDADVIKKGESFINITDKLKMIADIAKKPDHPMYDILKTNGYIK